ncbi:MAG: DMT family transporter [Alphaproteobacteria bacterium]|nr:MAG: DMT family transporter [Alphaproteobacteria bacterium]
MSPAPAPRGSPAPAAAGGGERVLLGIALMCGFAVTGPLIDTFAKLATRSLPVVEVVLARFTVQALALAPLALLIGGLHRPGRREWGLHLLRGALIVGATMFFFSALRVLPLAEAISIFFVEPLLLTLLGGLLLGEAIGWRRILAALVGFAGALVIIRPSFEVFGPAALLPLGTALCFAFYMILTRRMAPGMNPLALQTHTGAAAALLLVPVLWLGDGSGLPLIDPVLPSPPEAALLLGVGLAAAAAHLFITYALRFAPAATVAPLQYLEVVSASLLGWWVFGDLPDRFTLLGVAIIIASGLYVFARERRASRAISAAPAPPP